MIFSMKICQWSHWRHSLFFNPEKKVRANHLSLASSCGGGGDVLLAERKKRKVVFIFSTMSGSGTEMRILGNEQVLLSLLAPVIHEAPDDGPDVFEGEAGWPQ